MIFYNILFQLLIVIINNMVYPVEVDKVLLSM